MPLARRAVGLDGSTAVIARALARALLYVARAYSFAPASKPGELDAQALLESVMVSIVLAGQRPLEQVCAPELLAADSDADCPCLAGSDTAPCASLLAVAELVVRPDGTAEWQLLR